MNFKRIEMNGFKSFADRIEIKFDSGITAIVGPNGCGKSNVADAMRWVLGEQSSKQLRGSSMQDVIFKGTQNRKSLSYCEVSLVFDNSDHLLNLEYDEIIITRKLYRSGESEYAINRNPCRLKDIVNLLHDSGIGREGYSIIGQGKVAEIINSKPENRRAIFEEAAGISKFKSRKIETERKLERVHEDLVRINDIAREVERQLEPLKKQSENAKKYLELKEGLKGLEINAYLYNYENANMKKDEINKKINAITEELDLKEKQLLSCNNKVDTNMAKIQELDKEMDKLHEIIVDLSVKIEKVSGQAKLVQAKMDFLTLQGNKAQDDLNHLKIGKAQDEELLSNKQLKLQSNKDKLNIYNSQMDKLEHNYLSVVDELTENEDEVDKNQRLMLESMDKLSDIKSNLSRLKAEKDGLFKLSQEKQNRLDVLNEKLKADQEAKVFSDEESKKLNDEKKNISLKLDIVNRQIDDNHEDINNLSNEISNMQSQIASLTSRYKLLNEMQDDFDGFVYSVKNLLKEATKNNYLSEKIVGVVANLIKVPEVYQTAIEVALGNAVQNIVTKNEKDAIDLIDYLKQKRYGRATFLPLTSVKPRKIEDQFLKLIGSNGVFGVASSLIEFDIKLLPIFQSLLGATIIVDNVLNAEKIAKLTKYSFKIVTLDGDVIATQGSYTGGSKKAEINNVLGREKAIANLKDEIQNQSNELKSMQNKLTSLHKKDEDFIFAKQSADLSLRQIEINLAKNNQNSLKINANYIESQAEVENLRTEANKYLAQAKSIEHEINSVDELELLVSNSKTSANQGIKKRQTEFDLLKEKKEQYNIDSTKLKVNIATCESEILAFEEDILIIQNNILENNKKIDKLISELSYSQGLVDKEHQEMKKNKDSAEYLDLNNKLSNAKSQIDKLDSEKLDLQASLKVIEQERVMINSDYNRVKEKKYREDMNLVKIDTDLNVFAQRIQEEYNLLYEDCIEYKIENFDYDENLPIINNLKKEIQKLGNVNVNAIEDSKELENRYNTMSTEIEDLTKTENDLLQIINDLSQEMTIKFDDAFNKINDNFSRTFRELFGGGSAHLVLTEADDQLNAGVDIIAEPPGKKVTNLSLLSGGEQSLTAIAILFAILKLRPMPFCLLDEIEAALDDANVERFAKYLHRFSESTQFIVITHRKPTMELADNLYGVTMEEKGVSKIVSVKLSDAIICAEPLPAQQ